MSGWRLLAPLVALLLAVIVAGCGGDDGDAGPGSIAAEPVGADDPEASTIDGGSSPAPADGDGGDGGSGGSPLGDSPDAGTAAGDGGSSPAPADGATETSGDDGTSGSEGELDADAPADDDGGANADETSGGADLGDGDLGTVLLLGDSITEGFPHAYRYPLWRALTEDGYRFDFVGLQSSPGWTEQTATIDGRPFDADHAGVTGQWTFELGERLPYLLAELPAPDLVLLHSGTNDIAGGADPATVGRETAAIVAQLRAANPEVRVLLALIIPVFGEPEANEGIAALNAELTALAAGTPGVDVVDHNTDFDADANYIDEFHPSAAGATEMANRWLDAIASL